MASNQYTVTPHPVESLSHGSNRERSPSPRSNHGGITNLDTMRTNPELHCVPATMLDGEVPSYEDFLAMRRDRMAARIRSWFDQL
jgi:hypothetical protein